MFVCATGTSSSANASALPTCHCRRSVVLRAVSLSATDNLNASAARHWQSLVLPVPVAQGRLPAELTADVPVIPSRPRTSRAHLHWQGPQAPGRRPRRRRVTARVHRDLRLLRVGHRRGAYSESEQAAAAHQPASDSCSATGSASATACQCQCQCRPGTQARRQWPLALAVVAALAARLTPLAPGGQRPAAVPPY